MFDGHPIPVRMKENLAIATSEPVAKKLRTDPGAASVPSQPPTSNGQAWKQFEALEQMTTRERQDLAADDRNNSHLKAAGELRAYLILSNPPAKKEDLGDPDCLLSRYYARRARMQLDRPEFAGRLPES